MDRPSFCVYTHVNPKDPVLEKRTAVAIRKYLAAKGYEILPKQSARYWVYFEHARKTYSVTWTEWVQGPSRAIYDNEGNKVGEVEGETREVERSGTEVTRSLKVTIYDGHRYVQTGKSWPPVWEGTSSHKGRSPETNTLVDYFVVSVFSRLGLDSHGSYSLTLSRDHPDLRLFEPAQ